MSALLGLIQRKFKFWNITLNGETGFVVSLAALKSEGPSYHTYIDKIAFHMIHKTY
jgi:hypothetical protein